jgi:hypothetical protein
VAALDEAVTVRVRQRALQAPETHVFSGSTTRPSPLDLFRKAAEAVWADGGSLAFDHAVEIASNLDAVTVDFAAQFLVPAFVPVDQA